MSIVMPRVVQRPTPNYSPTAIRHDLVILHMMEGGYAGSVAWLCDPRADASAHLCLKADGSEATQLVPLGEKAWAQCAFNARGVSVEIEGFTAHGLADVTMRAAARVAAWLCRAYAIPPTWAKGGEGRGVCCHHDLGAAGGGHVDCSAIGSPEWLAFVEMAKAARDAFAAGPLPPWALHGLPNPHQAVLPPNAPPEPSHGGASRNGPGDVVDHPTTSGFPHGSTADLQWRLNKTGAMLTVDGIAGNATRNAIAAFQGKHGLFIDGLIGPATWAALDAATS